MGLLQMLLIWLGLVDSGSYSTNGYSEVGGNGSVHWKSTPVNSRKRFAPET